MAVGSIMTGTEQQPHPLVANIPGFKRPRIYDRTAVDTDAQRDLAPPGHTPDWEHRTSSRPRIGASEPRPSVVLPDAAPALHALDQTGKLHKVTKQQRTVTGRTFTSRFRGVHQTFPTKRWEAQFRRGGKPTSLGCFDAEEQAARAYDRMMIWCHLHKELSAKHGITNYDMKEYEAEYDWLMSISQEDLIESLRCDGRKQAATRQLRNKQNSSICAGVAHFDGQKGDKKGGTTGSGSRAKESSEQAGNSKVSKAVPTPPIV